MSEFMPPRFVRIQELLERFEPSQVVAQVSEVDEEPIRAPRERDAPIVGTWSQVIAKLQAADE